MRTCRRDYVPGSADEVLSISESRSELARGAVELVSSRNGVSTEFPALTLSTCGCIISDNPRFERMVSYEHKGQI